MIDRQMQERNLGRLVRNKAFKFSDTFFPYTSGEIGPYFVNSEAVMKNGLDYREAVRDMISLVRSYFAPDVISGGESRDWIFSLPVAREMGRSGLMIYNNGRIVPADLDVRGKQIVHVADLNNEGNSFRDKWIPTIKSMGGVLEGIVFYVDRMEKGVKLLEDMGIKALSVVPLDEHAWDYLLEGNVLSSEVYGNIRSRMEDPEGWARKMLESDEGLNELARLFKGSNEERGKAHKVLTEGYPDMSFELIERLGKIGVEIKAA